MNNKHCAADMRQHQQHASSAVRGGQQHPQHHHYHGNNAGPVGYHPSQHPQHPQHAQHAHHAAHAQHHPVATHGHHQQQHAGPGVVPHVATVPQGVPPQHHPHHAGAHHTQQAHLSGGHHAQQPPPRHSGHGVTHAAPPQAAQQHIQQQQQQVQAHHQQQVQGGHPAQQQVQGGNPQQAHHQQQQQQQQQPHQNEGRRVRVEGAGGNGGGNMYNSESEKWAVPPRYKLVKVIGSGSYGKVCHAIDQETGMSVAIKKIKRIFEDLIDCKRLLREIAILAFLDDPRTVRLIDVCVPDDPKGFTELYLVLELCDSDLKKLFKLPEYLSENHVVTLLFNTLCGLKYIHSAGIYHRDLKPANCLVNRDCSVKICDFGLSRPVVDPENEMLSNIDNNGYPSSMEDSQSIEKTRRLTGHVVTRWYRAPELILLQENYTEQIDVWSLGCIFAELLGMIQGNYPNPKERCPLFQGNTCYPLSPHKEHDKEYQYYYNRQSRDQLNVIFNVLGTPSEEAVEKLDKIDAKRYVRCFRERRRLNWDEMPRFQASSVEALDLLDKMLILDASERIDVDSALAHPLFKNLYSASKIRVADSKIVLEFENIPQLSESQLRLYFLLEIQKFHPELVIPDELLCLRQPPSSLVSSATWASSH